MKMKECSVPGCKRPVRNAVSPYCERHYRRLLKFGRTGKPAPIKLFCVFEEEDERGRPYLAEAEVIRVTESSFWLDHRKSKSFGYRTRIKRAERWFSFSPGEAVRLYLLQKRQELELMKNQIQEGEQLLEGIR